MNVKKKEKKCGKSYNVFKGLKGGLFKHTKTFFFLQNVFNSFNIYKKCILYQFQRKFKTYARNKKERNN